MQRKIRRKPRGTKRTVSLNDESLTVGLIRRKSRRCCCPKKSEREPLGVLSPCLAAATHCRRRSSIGSQEHTAGRGNRGSSQSTRGRGRGRGAVSSEQTPSPSPTTSTPAGTSHVAPIVPPATTAPLPQPASIDAERVDATPQPHAESSHASQPDPPAQQKEKIPITWDGQKGFGPDNNDCTQAISDTIELMLNESWINYSEIPEDVKRRWFDKWAEGFTWPEEEKKEIKKSYDYRAARRYQQIMREGEL
ncbi:hypothetical protein PIB30_038511 [Stylosanthes scabra]|uniref:Uncharacterized protein n=1 Tax=Stylosanthes scabra TaxID=79078 RepID=A0ABU6TEB7_9FABA|nr:hypothetical protein [Stylosanthes scabra]